MMEEEMRSVRSLVVDWGHNYRILKKIRNQNLLAKFYSVADVFVICSQRENFPTTCIEAQCCGTPVVGFSGGGTAETLVDERDAFVEVGDLDGLLQKIQLALQVESKQISESAIRRYSSEHMGKQYCNLYSRLHHGKRVLFINNTCKYTSTGKITYDLYRYAKEHNYVPAIAYGRGPKIEEDRIYKFGIPVETYFHAGMARLTGYNGCFSPLSTRRLLSYIEKFQPDIIHLHEISAYFVNIRPLLEYIKERHIKAVWTLHCEYIYTGKCGHAYECSKYWTECHDCPRVHAYPKSVFFDRTREMFQMKKALVRDLDVTIATPSRWLADRVRASFLKDKPLFVVRNGIDTSIFHPVRADDLRKELEIPNAHKIVLSVASQIMNSRKGGESVLKLAERMNGEACTFILVGA